MTKKQRIGLILLLTPFVLLVGTALLQIAVQFTLMGSDSSQIVRVVVNIFSLVAGLVGVLGFIPCLVIGIVFLATGGSKPSAQHNPTTPQPSVESHSSSAPRPPSS